MSEESWPYRFVVTLERQRSQHSDATWYLVLLPFPVADELDADAPLRGGFGSVPVQARIGSSVWRTSVFPTKETFLLLVNKKVRVTESLTVGAPVEVALRLRHAGGG